MRKPTRPALWVVLAGVLLFLRGPDLLIRPQLWAEDGPIFFLAAQRDGASAFLASYSGYFNLIPRSVAWLGEWIDPCLIPSLYVFSSLGLTLCVVALVFSSRLDLPAKPLIALAIVAVPHTGEVYLNLANIQWITALSLILTLFMRDPGDSSEWTVDILFLVFAGLTGPFGIFLLPFYLFRAISRGSKASWLLLSLVLLLALVQGWQVYWHTPAPPPNHPHGPLEIRNLAAVLSARIPLALFGAQGWVYRASRTFVLVAGAISISAIGLLASQKNPYRKQRICLLLFLILLTSLTVAKIRADVWDFRALVNADRYFFIPKVLLLWIVSTCLDRRTWGSCLVALPIAAGVLYSIFMLPLVERPYFPWTSYCEQIRAGDEVLIQVSPGWKFVLPARR